MATQRCRYSLTPCFLLSVAVILGNGPSARAADGDGPATSRPLMRLPKWIESLSGRMARQPAPPRVVAEDAAQKSAASRQPQVPTVPQAPTVPPPAAAAIHTESTPEATGAAVLRIASTPAESAEGMPGRALLRSRAAPVFDRKATLTAGWTSLVPDDSAAAHPGDQDTDAPEAVPPRRDLGPESSVLRGESSTAPAASAPESRADEDATTHEPTAAAQRRAPAPRNSIAAPIPSEPEQTPTLSIDPASFRGAHPGRTTRGELEASWGPGEAFTREDGTSGFLWKIEPFDRVEVSLDGDTVASIRIKLAAPVAVAELASQLEIADLRTVSILDEQGVSIGEVFPERGVIFSLKPGTRSATAVMLEPLDPESFVLRAEGEVDTSTANPVADLQYAVEIDPAHLRANRLLLVLMCDQGRWQRALQIAEAVEQLDPVDVWTRLKLAGVLLAIDRPDEARAKVESVLDGEDVTPLVAAQAQRMLGRIELACHAGEAGAPDYEKAVERFGEAIRLATPLLTVRSPSIQKAAREVLLDAHLGTALAIAKGNWQQKSRVIPKWIARSESLVEELKASPAERGPLEMALCRGALAVAAGCSDSIDSLPWVKRLLEVRERMGEDVSDPWRRRQIDWEVGQGLCDALVAAQKKGDAADMLDNATLTAAYLERGAGQRELTAAEKKNIGGLMFRIGVLHSLQRGDHATAVSWFDKALPMWEGNPAFEREGESGQLGESLVSMGISYWQVERREDALNISRRGVDMMVEAVDRRQLDERALSVAYGNLATMHAEQGDVAQSRTYAELAGRAESAGTTTK